MTFLVPPPPHPLISTHPPPPADPPTLSDLENATDFRIRAEKAARYDPNRRPQIKQALVYEQRISLAMDPDLLVERRAIEDMIDARIDAATRENIKTMEVVLERVVTKCLEAMHIDEKLASLEENLTTRIDSLSSRIDALEGKLTARLGALSADVAGLTTDTATERRWLA